MILSAISLIFLATQAIMPDQSDAITVDMRISKVVVFNNTPEIINYTIMERRAALYTVWKPCNHPDLCGGRGIKAGLSQSIPYRLISQWYPGSEVVVYWWRLVPDSTATNGYRVDGPYEKFAATPLSATLAAPKS